MTATQRRILLAAVADGHFTPRGAEWEAADRLVEMGLLVVRWTDKGMYAPTEDARKTDTWREDSKCPRSAVTGRVQSPSGKTELGVRRLRSGEIR